ncbi:MAG: hypothetical protein HOO93_09495 [Methyloglobulus sp.]|nr:hypothetical protein [Methyloglobulus sp.]
MFDKNTALEKFDDFLLVMDDQLEALENDAESRGIDLDFSVSSLEKLEQLFTVMAEGVHKDIINQLIVYFARYLGEIVRTNYGGKWHLSLDDPKNVNFNTPVIVGHTSIEDLEFAPIGIMRAFAIKRRSGMLWTAINADINPSPLDLSGLVEE